MTQYGQWQSKKSTILKESSKTNEWIHGPFCKGYSVEKGATTGPPSIFTLNLTIDVPPQIKVLFEFCVLIVNTQNAPTVYQNRSTNVFGGTFNIVIFGIRHPY